MLNDSFQLLQLALSSLGKAARILVVLMDSLNMNNLANSLPSSAIVKAEQDTMDKFRAAAQSLTLLYRSSQKAAKRHFDAGYATALEDILSVIQHGVSAGPESNAFGNGGSEAMSIGWILDWIEARQESIRLKARDEEEEDDEKDAKSKFRSAPKQPVGSSDGHDKAPRKHASSSPVIPTARLSGRHACTPASSAIPDPSPSPTLSNAAVTHSATTQSSCSSRPQTRARVRSQHGSSSLNGTAMNAPSNSPGSTIASVIGAKRRHAAMLLDSCAPSQSSVSFIPPDHRTSSVLGLSGTSPQAPDGFSFPAGATFSQSSGPRRRGRNSRPALTPRSENGIIDGHAIVGGDAMMDTEDDGGRERKRVTRRC